MAAAPQRGANPSFFLRYRYESGKAERATEELGEVVCPYGWNVNNAGAWLPPFWGD